MFPNKSTSPSNPTEFYCNNLNYIFIFTRALELVIIFTGIIFNLLIVFVYSHRDIKMNIVHSLFAIIAICDTLFNLIGLSFFMWHLLPARNDHIYAVQVTTSHLLQSFNLTLTVAIAVERNVAVYYPFVCKRNNDSSHRRRLALLLYCLSAMLLAGLVTTPSFIETVYGGTGTDTLTDLFKKTYDSLPLLTLIIHFVILTLVLIVLNVNIYRTQRAKGNVTQVVVTSIVVTVVCTTIPRLVTFLYFSIDNVLHLKAPKCDFLHPFDNEDVFSLISLEVAAIFSYVNTAANLPILFLYGTKFSKVLRKRAACKFNTDDHIADCSP